MFGHLGGQDMEVERSGSKKDFPKTINRKLFESNNKAEKDSQQREMILGGI